MNSASSSMHMAPLHPPPSVDSATQTEQQQLQMLRLHSADEAFRAISLLMAADKGYATAPISVAPRLWNAVRQRQYWLLVAQLTKRTPTFITINWFKFDSASRKWQ